MNIEELYQAALANVPDAEKHLFELLTARFRLLSRHRISNPLDAEDVVQESLMVICREYKGVIIERSFGTWAYNVLKHRILAYFSRKKTAAARNCDLDDEKTMNPAGGGKYDPEYRLSLMECLKKVAQANIRYARILNLHHQGYGTKEICDRMGITESNFYSILSRARSMLEHCLEDESDE